MKPEYMPFIWLGIAVVMGVLEALTYQLVSIWFVLGSIAGAVTCIFTDNIMLQVAVFLVISLAAIAVTRPFVKKITRGKKVRTNCDRYIGKSGRVTTEINNNIGQGQINVAGSIWSARTVDGAIVPVGTEVQVECIEGVKLMVKTKVKVEV